MKVTTDACLFGAILVNEISFRNKLVKSLDIGTGTGLLSLMLAQQHSSLRIIALELDNEAAEQARENINCSPWKDRIDLIKGDFLDYEPDPAYDLIFSNPPFYENDLSSPDAKINLARHNADLPLAKLLPGINHLLNQDGEAWLLLPYKRNMEIRQMLIGNDMFPVKIILIRNSLNHDYFRIILNIKKGKGTSAETRIDEFTIYEPNGSYTMAFESLLRPYYLRL